MAPREDDKAMEGLLRRKLARGADSAGVCPEPDIIAAYFERSLGTDEIERHELHFSRCARCREQLAAMARAGAPVAAGAGPLPATSPRFWLWDWRWLAVPAAAMLAFAIVGFLHMRGGKETARQAPASPPVALAKPEAQPSENFRARQDEKKTEESLIAPAQKHSNALSTRAPLSIPRVTMQNVVPLKPSMDSARDDDSGAKTAAKGMSTGAMANAAPRQQPLRESTNLEVPRSTSETVEVTSAAPTVRVPASPPVSASEIGGAAKGVNAGVGSVAPAASGANVAELEANAPRKKTKQEAQTAAAQTEITNAMTDSMHMMTVEGKAAAQMILTPDPAILWRFAGSGFVERSTDGGATWQGEEPIAGGQLVAGAAPSANVCWIVGRGGLILLTKDAKSWKRIAPPVDTDFIAVSAESAPNATVTAADGRKFATRDGGKKWKPAE
jgi:hypothetical protein